MPIPRALPSLYWRAAVYNAAQRRTGNSSTLPLGAGSPNAMGLVVKTSSWMLRGLQAQRAQKGFDGMPNLDAAILDALHGHRGCHYQLLRGAKGVQKEHAHQALTAQGTEGRSGAYLECWASSWSCWRARSSAVSISCRSPCCRRS